MAPKPEGDRGHGRDRSTPRPLAHLEILSVMVTAVTNAMRSLVRTRVFIGVFGCIFPNTDGDQGHERGGNFGADRSNPSLPHPAPLLHHLAYFGAEFSLPRLAVILRAALSEQKSKVHAG